MSFAREGDAPGEELLTGKSRDNKTIRVSMTVSDYAREGQGHISQRGGKLNIKPNLVVIFDNEDTI